MKIVVLKWIVIVISLISVILSFIFTKTFLQLLGIPLWVLLNVVAHELGHFIACLLMNRYVIRVSFYWFDIYHGKITINDNVNFTSFCKFAKGNNDAFIYMMGPTLSIFMMLCSIKLYSNYSQLLFLMVISCAFAVINSVPYGKKSDVVMFLQSIRGEG